MKDKTILVLIDALQKEGIINARSFAGAKQTIYSWIRRGILTPRQRPTSKWYVFTEEEIKEIIKEFSPGGSGFWKYTSNLK